MSLSVFSVVVIYVYALSRSTVFFCGSKGLALLFPLPSPKDPMPWYLAHVLLKQYFSNYVSHEISLVRYSQHLKKEIE